MKRYQFRLEPVLRVRRIEEDVARGALAAAQVQLAEADAWLAATSSRYEGRATPGGPAPATSWLAGRAAVDLAAASVLAAGSRRAEATQQLDQQREALGQARQKVSALERLDERHRDEHAVAARRDEDATVDDLVTSRHARKEAP